LKSPEQGNFRVTVKAARYEDGLLLDAGAPTFNLNANGVSGSAEGAGVRSSNFNFGVPNEYRRPIVSATSLKVARDDHGQN
jgi:hypothetical protein